MVDFFRCLGTKADRPLSGLVPRDIQEFIQSRLRRDGCPGTTVSIDGKILRIPLNYARRQGFIPTNPAEAVDLSVQGGGTRKISRRTFHALRHSFTSALANAGVQAEVRMKFTGHKSASSHQTYTHLKLDNLRAPLDKLPSLAERDS